MKQYSINDYALDLSKKSLTICEVYDKDVINQSIENILMTGTYERVLEPSYGSFLSSVVFERLDNSTAELLLDNIIELIIANENRISIKTNLCKMSISKTLNMLSLTIVYVIKADGTQAEFNKRIVY